MNIHKILKLSEKLYSTGISTTTDYALVCQIIENLKIDWTRKDLRILDMCCGRGTFLLAAFTKLLENGHTKKSAAKCLYGVDNSKVQVLLTQKLFKLATGVEPSVYYDNSLTRNWDMKFDVVVGNPPFAVNKHMIYPEFFAKSLDIADTVAMIMPENMSANWRYFINHNYLIRRHSTYISDNITHHFRNIGVPSMHYVIASKNVENIVEEVKDKFENYENIMSEIPRIKCIKGNFPTLDVKPSNTPDGIDVLTKVHQKGPVIEKHSMAELVAAKGIAWINNTRLLTTAPWVCFVNHTPSHGKFNTYVTPNTGNLMWSGFVFGIECDSEAEAKRLEAWLRSDVITEENRRLLKTNNTYSTSRTLIERLPMPPKDWHA